MAKIKNFFIKIGRWLKNHAPTKRRLIQIYSALLFNANLKGYFGKGNNVIYRGSMKYLCTPGLNCYSCPGAVTSCPLGALQNALGSSKTRAPYYIIGIIALLGLMLGRTICGFLCPTGLGQDLLYKIKSPKLRKSRYTRILSYFKYVLLVLLVVAIPLIYVGTPAFCKYICPSGTFGGALALLVNPANNDLYEMLGYLFSWKFCLLVVFFFGSIFIYRFFCRFFCPLGAILGFFNKFALIGVCFDKEKCTECGLCVQTCKMDVRHVGDHECINCGACVSVCPTNAISWRGSKIFLPASAIEEKAPVVEEKAPLSSLISALPEGVQPVAAAESMANTPIQAVNASVSGNNATSEQIPETTETPIQSDTATEKQPKKPRTKEYYLKRNYFLQMGAWIAAVAVLVTALVYFNFFAPTNSSTVYAAGDRCPDFTLDTFVSEGTAGEDGTQMTRFSTVENKGTVMVINFWYTTCGPCIAELPDFEEVQRKYGGDIITVAVHAPGMESYANIQKFIDENGWREWSIVFALDVPEIKCAEMLGKPTYPMTMIIDKSGRIAYVHKGKVDGATLDKEVASLL